MTVAAASNPAEGWLDGQVLSRLIWKITGATVVVSVAAAYLCGVRFAHAGGFLAMFAALIGPLVALRGYARWRGLGGERLIVFLDVVAAYLIFAFALVVAQQAAGAHRVPDLTLLVEHADRAMGFRWFDYVRTVSALPYLDTILAFCYQGWIGEWIVAMAALAFAGQFRAIGEFTVAYVLAAAVSIGCFASFDALSLGSVAAFHTPGLHHPSSSGPHYLHALTVLRSGADRTLDFQHLDGLISFPSLHAASALLLAVATRGLRLWRYPFLAFNVLIVVSTLSEGGHALCDVLAGMAMTCAAVAVAPALLKALTATRARFGLATHLAPAA